MVGRQDLFALLLLAVVAGVVVLLFALRAAAQRRRRELAARLAERFGIVQIRSTWLALELSLERPGWSGVLRAHPRAGRGFETIVFQGVRRAVSNAWSVVSRRYLPQPGPGLQVPLVSASLGERFVAFARRPEELAPFFDAEVETLLIGLDEGLAPVVRGRLAGVAVSVQGTEVSVAVTGQPGSDEEHLTRALQLIARVAEHGSTAAV